MSIGLASARAAAQVNVEPLRKQLVADGVGLRIHGSTAGFAGNSNAISVGGSTLMAARSAPHLGYVNASGDYGQAGFRRNVAKYFGHVRYDLDLRSGLVAEAFGQVESDQFRRIRLRELLGAGPRFRVHEGGGFDVHYGTAYMPEWTQYDDGSRRFANRWSHYVALAYKPDDRVLVSQTTYWQPRLDDFGDAKALSVTSLGIRIGPRLESKVDVTVRYESRPLAGVRTTDVEVKNALGIVLP